MFRRRVSGMSLLELVIVVVVIAVLSSMGICGYPSFTESRRQRTCMANVQTIETAMAMFQTQYTDLLPGDTGVIRFDAAGTIVDVTGSMARRLASGSRPLVRGSRAIAEIIRDSKVFCCPSARDEPRGNVHYCWVKSDRPVSLIEGGTQAAYCVPFRLKAEPGKYSRPHPRDDQPLLEPATGAFEKFWEKVEALCPEPQS